MAFPGRRLQETTPTYPSFPANWIPCSVSEPPEEYTLFWFCLETASRAVSVFRALLTNGNALMCHSVAPLPNFTHFLREDGLGTRQSLVGVCFRLRRTGVISLHFQGQSCLNQFVLFILLECSNCSLGGRRPVAYDRVCTMRFSSSRSLFNAHQLLEARGGATVILVSYSRFPFGQGSSSCPDALSEYDDK